MSPTSILSLAVELLQEIAFFAIEHSNDPFHRFDLRTLRRVCRLFKLAVDPLVFSTIRLDFNRRQAVLQHQIFTLSDNASSPSRHCRKLQIQRHPSGPPYYPGLDRSLTFMINPGNPNYDITTALRSLQNIKVVIWDVEDANLIEPVIEGLTQLLHLEELCLRFRPPLPQNLKHSSIFPLNRLPHQYLRRISLIDVSETVCGKNLTQHLCKIIERNPLLTHLDFEFHLDFECIDTRLGNCTFHTLVQDIPKESPLPLRHLRLRNCNLSFDNSTLSHLKFLSSIDVSSSADSNYEHLWLAFAATPTWLKEISVNKISQNLLNYLTLYSGLTKFCFIDESVLQCQEVDRFFTVILPIHRNSLSTLRISTYSPDFWCITPAYMTSMLTLQKIKSLTITLALDAISSAYYDGIRLLENMAMMAFHLPLLEFLRFDFSRSAHRFGCGTASYCYYKSTQDEAEKQILSVDISKLSRSWEYFQLQTPGKYFVVRKLHDSDGHSCMRFVEDLSHRGLIVN